MALDSWWWVAAAAALLAVAAAVVVAGRGRGSRRTVVVGTAVVAVVSAALLGVQATLHPVPAGYPRWLDLAVVPVGLAVALLALAAADLRRARPRSGRRLAAAAVAVPLSLAVGVTAANSWFGAYPTFSSLAGPHVRPMTAPAGLVSLPLPAVRARFRPRRALAWLPPAYARGDRQLPVIEMLAGTPGAPVDWVRGGGAVRTAAAYARHHDGVAPVLVFVDDNGSRRADTECVDSRRGQAETYLSDDVPADVGRRLGLSPTEAPWAVVGLSEGGECAAMLALRHPDVYRAFVDLSGLTGPSVGDAVEPTTTTRLLFDGDTTAYDQHDPLWLLDHRPARLDAFWASGSSDRSGVHAERLMSAVAARAGLWSCATVGRGEHTFYVWAAAFARDLPSLAAALGLGPAVAPRGCTAPPVVA